MAYIPLFPNSHRNQSLLPPHHFPTRHAKVFVTSSLRRDAVLVIKTPSIGRRVARTSMFFQNKVQRHPLTREAKARKDEEKEAKEKIKAANRKKKRRPTKLLTPLHQQQRTLLPRDAQGHSAPQRIEVPVHQARRTRSLATLGIRDIVQEERFATTIMAQIAPSLKEEHARPARNVDSDI